MTTLERIFTEADDYGFQVPYDGTKKFYDDSKVKGYIAGAKSERNKVVDEIIEEVNAFPMLPAEKEQWITYLNSLKVKDTYNPRPE